MPIYFHLSDIALPISIESIGNDWSQVQMQRPEGYPLYHWLQTEEGSGDIIVGQQTIHLAVGQGILIRPFEPHSYYPVEKWRTNFVTFDGELKSSLSDMIGASPYLLASDQEPFSFTEWINDMVLDYENGRLDDLMLSSKSYQFLLQLRQKHAPLQHHQLFTMYVEPAIDLMKSHYNSALTIESIAETLFISPQYLTRLFKRFTHDSPYKYLTSYRISRSKELLVNQAEMTVQDIASRVGFDSPSQFNYLFKQKTGYTPGQFRKLYY